MLRRLPHLISLVGLTILALLVVHRFAADILRKRSSKKFFRTELVEADEVWSFVYSKEKKAPQEHRGEYGYGDVWTWWAVDADTKLIFSYHIGMRTPDDGRAFIYDMAFRVNGHFQLTTHGLKAYQTAVREVFGQDIDFAHLVKQYGEDPSWEKRYSPAICTGCDKTPRTGNPDMSRVSTSYVERTNLTLRMRNRRFTRLINAHSKKLENHEASIALHLIYYNFARVHETLSKAAKAKTTPAMAAGITDHVWTIADFIGVTGEI